MSSIIRLNIWAIITRIKKYKSIMLKKNKKGDEIALLAITNLDSIKGLFMSLTDLHIEYHYFNIIDRLKNMIT